MSTDHSPSMLNTATWATEGNADTNHRYTTTLILVQSINYVNRDTLYIAKCISFHQRYPDNTPSVIAIIYHQINPWTGHYSYVINIGLAAIPCGFLDSNHFKYLWCKYQNHISVPRERYEYPQGCAIQRFELGTDHLCPRESSAAGSISQTHTSSISMAF